MHKTNLNLAKASLSALGAVASLGVISPALAVQSDAAIDQVTSSSTGNWSMDQVSAVQPAGTYLVQIVAPKADVSLTFQANVARYSSQLSMNDQVPGSAGSFGAPIELAILGHGLDLGRFARSGHGSSTGVDDQANRKQQAWNGAGNLQASFQQGYENRSIQDQVGFRNAALIVQDGQSNTAETRQFADHSVASILQTGQQNVASIVQRTNSSYAMVSQFGNANIASVRQ